MNAWRQEQIVALVKANGPIARKDIVQALGMNEKTAGQILSKLKRKGLLVSGHGYYSKWSIPEQPAPTFDLAQVWRATA